MSDDASVVEVTNGSNEEKVKAAWKLLTAYSYRFDCPDAVVLRPRRSNEECYLKREFYMKRGAQKN